MVRCDSIIIIEKVNTNAVHFPGKQFMRKHFIDNLRWIVLFQFWFSYVFGNNTVLLFLVPIGCAYAATLVCSVISIKIPVLSYIFGGSKK